VGWSAAADPFNARRSFLTGTGTAAPIASAIGSHTTPGCAARGATRRTSATSGVMCSVKWVNPCRSTPSRSTRRVSQP